METTNLALIGCGYWGINLLRVFSEQPGANIRYVCDLSEQNLARAKARCPQARVDRTFEDALRDAEVHGVIIATPSPTHAEMASAALASGKHVFVEKPLAMRAADAIRVKEQADRSKLTLLVGHTFLYNATVRKVRELIARGELGDIYYLYSQRLNLGIVRQDVNVMWNLAPHDLSICMYWCQQTPISVQAVGHTYLQKGIPDVAHLHLMFPSGQAAHIHLSWLDPHKVRRATVVGSRKMLIYNDTLPDQSLTIYDKGIDLKRLDASLGDYGTFGEFQLIQRAGDIVIPKIALQEPLVAEAMEFLESIRTGRPPLTDGRNGVEVVKVLEACQRSLDEGGLPIRVEN